MSRTVFFISDGTGITAETLGHTLLTQFETNDFKQVRIPFVDGLEKANAIKNRINQASAQSEGRAIVFNTVVNKEYSAIISTANALVINFFGHFLKKLEDELGMKSTGQVGRAHGMVDSKRYEARISAMNYALNHDDGVDTNFERSNVILVGVSRSGKTPTCLYLALHYGILAGNYPLTVDDLDGLTLPKHLRPYRKKLFGLTIDPERLHQIREKRRPGSQYANMKQCIREVSDAEQMFELEKIPNLNTTTTSIEEIASKILLSLSLEKDFV